MSSPWDEPVSPWDTDLAASDATGVSTTADDLDALEPLSAHEELEVWTARAHTLWREARQAGDLRSASSALAVAFRNLKSTFERERAECDSSEQDRPDHAVTLAELDAIVKTAREQIARRENLSLLRTAHLNTF